MALNGLGTRSGRLLSAFEAFWTLWLVLSIARMGVGLLAGQEDVSAFVHERFSGVALCAMCALAAHLSRRRPSLLRSVLNVVILCMGLSGVVGMFTACVLGRSLLALPFACFYALPIAQVAVAWRFSKAANGAASSAA